jgi:Ni,Fe-hydrogenase maturation factor
VADRSLIVDAIEFGLEIGKGMIVNAKGSPAQIVAVGAAAGITVLAAATGYLIYKGGGLLYDKLDR